MVEHAYEVGFKDVYPWVWSVMLGVALTLAERRGAFQSVGTSSPSHFWAKNVLALALNLGLPVFLFGLTMIRVGPRYSPNMDFWQILGSLYLAGAPLGSHHLWLTIARRRNWLPEAAVLDRASLDMAPRSTIVWVLVALAIPVFAAIFGLPLPY